MKIRVGETYQDIWEFYNPLSDDPDHPNNQEPDLDNPINLSGITVSFVLEQLSLRKTYPADGGAVTVTAADGKIEVELTPMQTSVFKPGVDGESYLLFTTGGKVTSYAQEKVKFVEIGAK